MATCLRETREGIGIDLSNNLIFEHIGRTDDIGLFTNGQLSLVVGCHIFALKTHSLSFMMDSAEISAVTWCGIDTLMYPSRRHSHQIIVPHGFRSPLKGTLRSFANYVYVDQLLFPAIRLDDTTTPSRFLLWGLTLNFCENVFRIPPIALTHSTGLLGRMRTGRRFQGPLSLFYDVWWVILGRILRIRNQTHFSYQYGVLVKSLPVPFALGLLGGGWIVKRSIR